MNISKDFIYRLKYINRLIENGINFIHAANIESYISELNEAHDEIENILLHIKKVKFKLLDYKLSIEEMSSNDLLNKKLYDKDLKLNLDNFPYKKKIIEVDDISQVPEMKIYYIRNIKQYAINLNGMLLRGNIGNIYKKQFVKHNPDIKNVIYCSNQNTCKKILTGKFCKYYHDPLVLLNLKQAGLISDQTFESQLGVRNFIDTSWLYVDSNTKKSEQVRRVGSLDTLQQYMQLMKLKNDNNSCHIINYKEQCMHDILVLYLLHNHV